MKIAIISDIHENFHNLALFLTAIQNQNIEKIIFLGDFINAGIAKMLVAYPIPTYAIRGNNDGDKVALTKASLAPGSNLEIGFETFDILEIDGRKLFLTHYPMLAKPMAKSGDFHAVFYGHNHEHNIEMIENCLILNPGEISAHKTGKATFAIYDTTTNTAELHSLENIQKTTSNISENYLKDQTNFQFSKTRTHQY